MALWIKLAEDIFVKPGTSLAIKVTDFIDYLRVRDNLLEQDTYLCYLLQKEHHGWLSLHVCSSQTLKVIASYLSDKRVVESFDYAPFTKEAFLAVILETNDGILKALELRKRFIESRSQKELLILTAKTLFLRAFWKEVLSTYDPVKRRVTINYGSYAWLRENRMSNFWMNDLLYV